ncbi:MAG: GTPase/DUF3482 domain-containing protein [Opitutales bacterium]|nr:GTPase/DUF3482 domain-containing protein [Opitutales bacterium]
MKPIFAIMGHPNEGKSSVLSTLAEDDSVVISSFPGETIVCRKFPFRVNGVTLLEFVDTPGFQNPTASLRWMRNCGRTDTELIEAFIEEHNEQCSFHHDCELLKPLQEGAGVIYVVDASRPLMEVDIAEMEILRLINRPRMAIINFKKDDSSYVEEWKTSLRRHFNVIREFNAHEAKFSERIALFEALRVVQQEWEQAINDAVEAIYRDWKYRKSRVAEIIAEALAEAVSLKIEKSFTRESDAEAVRESALASYRKKLEKTEKRLFGRIRDLYRHHVYEFRIPASSLLHEGLFSEKTWQIMGLKKTQLIWTAAGAGAGIGAMLDVAASGLTFGIFSTTGAILGGGGVLLKAKDLAKVRLRGIPLGGSKVVIGPNRNPQFPFIFLDRALLYFKETIRHAHGKRTSDEHKTEEASFFVDAPANRLKSLGKAATGGFHADQGALVEQIEFWLNRVSEE